MKLDRRYENSQEGDKLEGKYVNYFEIGYNAFEFVLDFGQLYPENGEVRIHTRIITGPVYGKALAESLQESICRYEHTFGVISEE